MSACGWSVCLPMGGLYVCPWVSCANWRKPIEMLFGGLTHVGPRNHILDGVQVSHVKGYLTGAQCNLSTHEKCVCAAHAVDGCICRCVG